MQKALCLHNRMLGFKSKLFQVREKYICHIIFEVLVTPTLHLNFLLHCLYIFFKNDAPKLIQASS